MGDRLGTAGVVGFFFSLFDFFPSHARLLPTFFSYIPFYLRFSMHISFFSFAYPFFNIYSMKIVIVAWKISQMFYSFSRLTQKGEFTASKQHKDYCWNKVDAGIMSHLSYITTHWCSLFLQSHLKV